MQSTGFRGQGVRVNGSESRVQGLGVRGQGEGGRVRVKG
jgi:hypothetical protein